ncbi:thymidylate kinase [Nitzschia inconspicua]|uniref:Thymidylate kinase n=1 Tax=Nitzschia inconspicua TaxID=303405 RepID=A0A9K3M4Z8_9STRA|nr:thymidylate kinase [Nitzschia inconspicua]
MSSIIDLSQQNDAYGRAVPHGIHGLYSSLAASATILRIAHAMGELDASVAKQDGENTKSGNKLLEDFFYQLDEMELEWNSPRRPLPPNPPCYHVVNGSGNKPRIQSYIVVVEGLDGSGKSSLVQNLVGALNETKASNPNSPNVQAMSMATPTQSMANVRPVFDKRGGPVARAFYAVSNYMLQHEIQQRERQLGETANHGTILVAIVDRWYTSTVAYSVAWKNTNGDEQSIDELDSSIFAWPKDLRRPNMLFLLQVNDQVRRERVNHRSRKNAVEEEESSTQNSFNPWDQRLDQDENLGRRIMRSFERVAESFSYDERDQTTKVIRLDANQAQDKVLIDADRAVQEQLLDLASFRILHNPLQQFDRDPLGFFTWVSSEMKLCHPSTGKRLKHACSLGHASSVGQFRQRGSIKREPYRHTSRPKNGWYSHGG